MSARPRLVLLGGGHAQLFVLDALRRGRFPPADVTLVSPEAAQSYSGMVPALLAGTVPADAARIALEPLARAAGVRFELRRAAALDAAARTVALDDGRTLPFDVLSIATGSAASGLDLPGVRAHAWPIRPLERAEALAATFDARLDAAPGARVVVVGGGVGGVEVACALRARARARGQDVALALVGRDAEPAAERAPATRAAVLRALAREGIAWRGGLAVTEVTDTAVVAGAARLPADLVVWATGAAPAPLARAAGLADEAGWFAVEPTLAVRGAAGLFAAGDCARLVEAPGVPRAGVYAVRQGPVLARNLAAALAGRPLRRYRPQRRYLALIETSATRAVFSWGELAREGRWPLALKRRIDGRFLARFRA